MEQQGLKIYSLGIVLENKEANSDMIKVMPIEKLSLVSGPLDDQKVTYDVNLPDSQGVKKTDKIEGGVEIVAKWIFGGGNRLTAPDVAKQETVVIYQFADTDEYYWQTIFREPTIRRLEHVNFSFSNQPKGIVPYDKNSSYWLEVSTRDKHVHLHTCKNDGELYEYDIKIDTADGNFTITDDVSNSFTIDSKTNTITINQSNGSVIIMNDTGVTVNTKEFLVNADKINLNAPEMAFTGNGLTVSGDSINIAGGSVALTGGAITANGEDLNTDIT